MNYSIELIRLLAVVLITFTHTRHNFVDGPGYIILEEIPTYGTLILSIVSGYLYWKVTRFQSNMFKKKIKSLLIPYLLANLFVLLPVLLAYYFLNIDFLNRLSFDFTLITDGIFSLGAPPINPPTYFIKDILIVFVLIEMFRNRNLWMLLIILAYAVFGHLMLRYDILALFILGMATAEFKDYFKKWHLYLSISILAIVLLIALPAYGKFAVSYFIFIALIDRKIKFRKTGAYSYLLHLYHSPVIVLTHPLVEKYVENIYLNVAVQILLALSLVYILFRLSRLIPPLRILSGGR